MKNYKHYNVEQQPPAIQQLANDHKLVQPCFIGQGCTKHVGSNSHGYYVVAKKTIGRKTIWGIAAADAAFGPEGWISGSMYCSIDINAATPTKWITSYGKTKVGNPKWWFCNENGKRYNGDICKYGWNGAYAYQDPSF